MADYKPRNLKAETHVAVFVSTYGEGDAPDDAIELHEFLAGKKAPKLADTKYAVLGLVTVVTSFSAKRVKTLMNA